MTNQAIPDRTESRPPRTPTNGIVQVLDLMAAEHSWQAGPGIIAHGYGYNAQVPGPTIEATVGDTLLVRFTNLLSRPTGIQWHGLRVSAATERRLGAGASVAPGASAEYKLELPDAGTYWYHPPIHQATQLQNGLYGALIVRDPNEPVLDGDRVLVFGDLNHSFGSGDAEVSARSEVVRLPEASRLLVNGFNQPDMEIGAGQVERWRLVNAASGAYVRLSLGGAPITVVGTDGGPVSEPIRVDEVMMAPGERLELVVGPFAAGQSIPVEDGRSGPRLSRLPQDRLASLHVVDGHGLHSTADLQRMRFARDIPSLAGVDGQQTRVIQLGERWGRQCPTGSVQNVADSSDEPVPVGQLQVWDICNGTDENRVFHLRGFFFQTLHVNGTRPPYRSWKDTTSVPARSCVRIAWLPDSRPGRWGYHSETLARPGELVTASFDVVD